MHSIRPYWWAFCLAKVEVNYMTEYMIRKDGYDRYTVTKWNGGAMPIAIYQLELSQQKRITCTCASGTYRKYCKHIDMIKEIRKNPKR